MVLRERLYRSVCQKQKEGEHAQNVGIDTKDGIAIGAVPVCMD